MHCPAFKLTALAATAAVFSFSAHALPTRIATSKADALQSLTATTGGALTQSALSVDHFNAVHSSGATPLFADDGSLAPLARAQQFLSLYGSLVGVKDAVGELQLVRQSNDAAGNTHVHLDQYYQGLPVFGARLIVHMNKAGITGTNGVFIEDLAGLSTTPALAPEALQARAVAAAHKLHPKTTLAIESSRLMVYRTGLLKGVEGQNYLAYEVMVKGQPGDAVREQIILNANTGNILNRIDRIESILNRKIYTPVLVNPATNTEAMPVYTEKSLGAPTDPAFTGDTKGNPASTRTHGPGTQPLDNLYLYAGGTWQMYKNLFGRDGYDDGFIDTATGKPRMQVQKSVYLANEQCPNAYWDGTSTNYCPGFDADDVVSHEWSHAYTEYTDNLVYQYQSGALNESNSDIFGETYDLIDGFEGPLSANLTEGTTYDKGGSRWVVGEDLSDEAAQLLLRDMWDPDNFRNAANTRVPVGGNSPGSSITSTNYECSTSDNGGVHTNSGVSNHAYAMLVDGKTFNGHTVKGIGLVKAAHIYFQAKTHYGTPTQNFPQHADGLEQACADLTGVPLNDVFGKPFIGTIDADDCKQVHEVTLAVEFRGRPDNAGTAASPRNVAQKCAYVPVLKPEASTPKLCTSGFVTSKFFESFDGAALPASWTQGKNLTGDKDIAPWTISKSLPAPHNGSAAFFKNDTGGTCSTGGDESASHYLDSPAITVTGAADFFTFTHFLQSEQGFDGGNLKYSLNNGAFAIVPAAAFTYNGHSSVFGDAPAAPGAPSDPVGLFGDNTSPNAGQVAWTGSDQGEATGSWGTTIVNLAKLTTAAKAGDKIKFRFDFANDGCGGNLGWFIDQANEFICAATPPPNTLPVASLSADKTTGQAPLAVQLTLGGSDADVANGDRVASYSASAGDGSSMLSEDYAAGSDSKTVTHTYNMPGTYTVMLTVKDTTGAVSAPAMQKITVTAKDGVMPTPTPTPINPAPTPTTTTVGSDSGSTGRFGGAMGLLALLPMAGLALRRRRRAV